MKKWTGKHLGWTALIAVIFCATTSAFAGADDDWRFSITPYLWLPSINTQLRIKDVPLEVDSNADSFDVLSKLDFAMLLGGELRKGKVGLIYDFQILKLSDDGTLYAPDARGYDYGLTFADATLALGYRVIDNPQFSTDLFAGGRVLYAKTSIDIDATPSAAESKGEQSKTWIDPIIGAKCRYQINPKWAVNGYADIGGFDVGSKLTYQLMGTVSYNFSNTIALQAGYRFFADNFESGAFKFDTKLYGPIVGLTFVF